MSKDNRKAQDAKAAAAKTPPAKPVPAKVPVKVPPLFRKIDWLVLIIVFGVVWAVYLFTLAPELTLEDCGELCTASFYAGVPHPPGYPFWSIYSWLWTVIVPFGNVTWRVEVGESFALAMACGLVGFMVSRGSSMLMEGIEELKGLTGKWENAICIVCGIVSGLLLGFDAFVWNEAVVINRISIFDVPWIMLVALCLLRWLYAPHQRRYLYIAMFFFGLCATIHQTMLCAAMGIEVCIAFGLPRLGRDLFLGNSIIFGLGLIGMSTGAVSALNTMDPMFRGIFYAVGIGSIAACIWLSLKTKKIGTEWKAVLFMGLLWLAGASFYFYEPISCMTDPPMQWAYPRTVQGFFHALSRGQYAAAQPTDIIHHPEIFMMQLGMLVTGLASSYSWVYIFIALLPFFFLRKMQNRERSWIIGLASIYLCIGILLTILMNTSPDRQDADENKVFFAASHAVVTILIGYGLALMTAYMAVHYEKFRRWGLAGGAVAVVLAFYCLMVATGKLYFGPAGEISFTQLPHYVIQAFAKNQYGSPVFANLILLATPVIFMIALWVYRQRAPVLIALCLFSAAPVYSALSHWYKSEQRNHWFGYWFGHDMFTPPYGIYPEMARDAIVFGGTDPGRFCPTYMIFCESFIPHRDQPYLDQKFDRRDCYLITQNALADNTYLEYLRAQYNRSTQQDPPFFSRFFRYVAAMCLGDKDNVVTDLANPDVGKGNTGNALIEGVCHLLDNILDKPLAKMGADVEARRRAEGVYPPHEIYIPTDEDSQECFQEYAREAQLQSANGQVQVAGEAAVMTINGLLCKVIFNQNPTNEFYVEESFPLDWMYPYETPFGIIMKINRNPVPELSADVLKKNHEFWSEYSQRLIGNWITYDTTVQQIADFAEKVYLGNNYTGFTGDRRFIRDDDAQKAFSKLRSSQAGMLAWRCGLPNSGTSICPPEYRQKTEAAQQALIKEADFAFKQAFAFCPYSPEAVYRYVNFLLPQGRLDDALIVAQTCLKLDPYNSQVSDLVDQLKKFKAESAGQAQNPAELQQMETEAQQDPTNVQNLLTLGSIYLQMHQTNRAVGFFDEALTNPDISYNDVAGVAQIYARMGYLTKVKTALDKLTALEPGLPEPRYDLARLEAAIGQDSAALQDLQTALDLSARRLKTNAAARNLLLDARKDPSFNSLRSLPAFQKLVPPG